MKMNNEKVDLKKFYHNDLTDKEFKTLEDFRSIQQEKKDIEDRFAKALELSKQEVETLTEEVEALEKQSQEAYTKYVVGDVEASVYTDLQKQLADTKEKLVLSQSKVDSIHLVEVAEIKAKIMPKIDKILPAYRKVVARQESLVRRDLLLAKAEYLKIIKNGLRLDNNVDILSIFTEEIRFIVGERHSEYTNFTPSVNKYTTDNYYTNRKGIDISKESLGANN